MRPPFLRDWTRRAPRELGSRTSRLDRHVDTRNARDPRSRAVPRAPHGLGTEAQNPRAPGFEAARLDGDEPLRWLRFAAVRGLLP